MRGEVQDDPPLEKRHPLVYKLTCDDIQNAVLRYERELDRYEKLADLVYEQCLELVVEIGIRATVQRRAKSSQSLIKRKGLAGRSITEPFTARFS